MPRARAAVVAAIALAAVATACGGSDSGQPPVTTPPVTEAATATPETTPAATPETAQEDDEVPLEIVTLLPPDAIPAIDNPRFISLEEADQQLRLSDLVIGVSIDGEHRAYGAAFLSGHEIVNDTLGGRAIAVTW